MEGYMTTLAVLGILGSFLMAGSIVWAATPPVPDRLHATWITRRR